MGSKDEARVNGARERQRYPLDQSITALKKRVLLGAQSLMRGA
jgi:hypothetical protein